VVEWSKAPDSSSGPRKRVWVQIPLLTINFSIPIISNVEIRLHHSNNIKTEGPKL
ncbi:hypothetical protein LINPERHAP2_LOCUS13691, partial [Linum perenne]